MKPSETGSAAEAVVASYLRRNGFDVVASNLKLGRLEIDLVARQGPLLVVVEVRSRGATAWTTPFGSIDTRKRLRVRRAGERLWQRRYRDDPSAERMRFDAASVTFGPDGPRVDYVEAAF